MRNLSATLLLLLACVTDSTLSGSTSWKVVPAVVNKVRSILERLEKGGRGDEQTPLTKNGLQDLLRTIQNAAREGTAGGSSWYRCELDTVDAKDMTRALFQLHHARKVRREPFHGHTQTLSRGVNAAVRGTLGVPSLR